MNKSWNNVSLALIGTAAGAVVLSACDTTAFVSPKIRRLSTVQSTGAIGAQCNLTQAERDYTLRFLPISTDQRVIEPGERLVGFTVDLGGNFTEGDVSILENTGTVYPAPDVLCRSDADCVDAGLSGFTCESLATAQTSDPGVPQVCARDISLSIDTNVPLTYSPRLPEDDGARQRSVVAMFYRGDSILGICPDTGLPGCRLDPENRRAAGFTSALRTLFSENSPFAGGVEVCTGGYGSTTSDFLTPAGATGCFQRFGSSEAASSSYTAEMTSFVSRGEQGVKMNYLAGLRDGIERFQQSTLPNADRHLIIYVDQAIVDADIIADNTAFQLTVDSVLAQALDAKVTIHAVQLDRATIPSTLPNQDAPNPFGRSGPLADLARLTCETGGTFQYAESPGSIDEAYSSLGFGLPASYEVAMSLGVIGNVPAGPYRLATRLNVKLGNSTQLYDFGGYVAASGGRVDRRLLVQLNGCASADECLPGYACSDGICQARGDFGSDSAETPEEETPEEETPEEETPEEETPEEETPEEETPEEETPEEETPGT